MENKEAEAQQKVFENIITEEKRKIKEFETGNNSMARRYRWQTRFLNKPSIITSIVVGSLIILIIIFALLKKAYG